MVVNKVVVWFWFDAEQQISNKLVEYFLHLQIYNAIFACSYGRVESRPYCNDIFLKGVIEIIFNWQILAKFELQEDDWQ